MFAACGSKPTDLRTLVPADTLVYLETPDLGQALTTLTDARAFRDAAKQQPDFSALKGVQTAVAVTGFEASENQVTAENSILNFKPRFVAVADTHTWNRYALRFAENQLGEFVNETYGGEVTLDEADKNGGRSFVWTAKDGRRAFAFVTGSRVFFSNDEAALERTLAVARGEADSLVKNDSLARLRDGAAKNALAFGYVAPDGVAQLANLAGVSAALDATDDEQGRSFIARVLPQVLRNSVKEATWTATATEQGIEDRYAVTLSPETTAVVKETLVPAAAPANSAEYLPADVYSATRYNLQNPQIAWRSLLLVAGKNAAGPNTAADPLSGKIILAFSDSLLEPYGIRDAEGFLSAVEPEIWTANADAEGDKTVAVFGVKDAEKLKQSISGMNFKAPAEKRGAADVWKNADGTIAAAFVGNRLILGETETVAKCLDAPAGGQTLAKSAAAQKFSESGAVAVTYGKDSTEKTVDALGEKKSENLQMLTAYTTETRFNASGLERRTVSPFGLLGRLVEQFDE
ncbi:MAG: hypothetical protein JSS81_15385 [Acidobacteria bacterium]|nr:hypothetical protein [Acidobacteriota bacterium]